MCVSLTCHNLQVSFWYVIICNCHSEMCHHMQVSFWQLFLICASFWHVPFWHARHSDMRVILTCSSFWRLCYSDTKIAHDSSSLDPFVHSTYPSIQLSLKWTIKLKLKVRLDWILYLQIFHTRNYCCIVKSQCLHCQSLPPLEWGLILEGSNLACKY